MARREYTIDSTRESGIRTNKGFLPSLAPIPEYVTYLNCGLSTSWWFPSSAPVPKQNGFLSYH